MLINSTIIIGHQDSNSIAWILKIQHFDTNKALICTSS